MPKNFADSVDFRADVADCRRLLRGGSRSFYAASFLLPRSVREPASALYAFCRLADDAVDLQGARADAVPDLRDRLNSIYHGRPRPIAADRALAAVVRNFGIPIELPLALVEGLEWDASGKRYWTLDDVLAYAARVAGAVGAMMALIMGARSRHAVARACDLGVAMQLSNIARDVGEDARAGRIYLPLEWFQGCGMHPETFIREPMPSKELGDMIERLLGVAEVLYQRADAGIAMLPATCRPGIRAARRLYAAIGHEVLARDCDSVSGRAVVGARRKCGLLLQVLTSPASAGPDGQVPPLPQTRYLVDAAARGRRVENDGVADSISRAAWLIELFTRLEERERARRGS